MGNINKPVTDTRLEAFNSFQPINLLTMVSRCLLDITLGIGVRSIRVSAAIKVSADIRVSAALGSGLPLGSALRLGSVLL